MKPSQAIRFGIAAIVLVLLLAACMHPSDSGSSASGSSSGSSTSESTTSPAIEQTTGLESPQSPTHGNPSLSLPSPPVGNNGQNVGVECIQIAWLTGPIPHGDVVTITSVTVPGSPFSLDLGTTAGCKGGRSCIGYQFSESNDTNGAFCNVGVAYEGEGTVDPGNDNTESGTIVLAGRLSCPNISSAKCRDDGVVMEAAARRPIFFSVGIDPPTSPPTTSSSSGSTSSSPTTSDSSSPVAPGSP
jgi:hypothetical protein